MQRHLTLILRAFFYFGRFIYYMQVYTFKCDFLRLNDTAYFLNNPIATFSPNYVFSLYLKIDQKTSDSICLADSLKDHDCLLLVLRHYRLAK
ncbi:MAG: hypothetical protein K0R78_136 [Pelosinus sp.]|nr:hypothetical protein [Pelosinus sp.]